MTSDHGLEQLLQRIRACRLCATQPLRQPLPQEPNPVLQASAGARLLIAGQAPGVRVHLTGVPFNDRSGDRLRAWMGVDRALFYDESRIAIAAMSFCFPGHDRSGGDLPPRRECRFQWRDALLEQLPCVETILAIGRYAQDYHLARLGATGGGSVGETVARWRDYACLRPKIIPLPHPSWRNTGWLKRHPWFEEELLPELRQEIARLFGG